MQLLPLSLPDMTLASFCFRQQWGATFQDALYARPDGTYQLRFASNHPDFEGEAHELTEREGAEWLAGERAKLGGYWPGLEATGCLLAVAR